MKNKIIIPIVCVAVFLVAGILWLRHPGLPCEKVMPKGALLYARFSHVEKHVNEMQQSDLWKSISSIDLQNVLVHNGIDHKKIAQIIQGKNDLQKFWDNPFVHKIIGQEVSIAFYQQGNGYDVLMAMRLGISGQIAELLGQMSRQWDEETVLTREKYQGITINHIFLKKKNMKFAYVTFRDLLVASAEPAAYLKQVIDTYQFKHASLAEDPNFLFVSHHAYPSADGFVFVSTDFKSLLRSRRVDALLQTHGYLSSAFPVYGLSYMSGEVNKYKLILGLNFEQMQPQMRKSLACPPSVNDSLKFVPQNALFYNWGSCYDFPDYWQSFQEQLQSNPALGANEQKMQHTMEKRLHFTFQNDVIPMLGHEVGGYLTDVDMQGMLPFPRLLLFVKVQDHTKAQLLMDKITKNPLAMLSAEDYNNVNIHYMTLPLGANMDPGYCFLGDYLLVATSRQLLKKSIDTSHDSGLSLSSDDVVKKFDVAPTQNINSMTLMKTGELARRGEDLLGWVNKYLSSQVTMAATYQQDGASKAKDLDDAINDKKAELKLAEKKIEALKNKPVDTATDDPTVTEGATVGALENLQRDIELIHKDIDDYKAQKEELIRTLTKYKVGAKGAKLDMFNMENILSPIFKGLESINAQAITVKLNDKALETEILVK